MKIVVGREPDHLDITVSTDPMGIKDRFYGGYSFTLALFEGETLWQGLVRVAKLIVKQDERNK